MLEQAHFSNRKASFRLNDGVFLVDGAKRSALYDTIGGGVYSLNHEAANAIKSGENDKKFISKLASMDLIDNNSRGVEKLPSIEDLPQPKLNFAWLEITDQCNERCLHCYGNFSQGENGMTTEYLTNNDWKNIISDLSKNGCYQIQFIGGEPFRYHDKTSSQTVLDLAEFARKKGVNSIEIFTNGTLISKKEAERIKELNLQIALSIYSSIPEVHDRITQIPGSFRKTMETINILKEKNIPTRAAVILMKQNEETIEETLELICKLGLNIRPPDVVRPNGRAQQTDVFPDIKTFVKYGLITEPNFSTDITSFLKNHLYNTCLAGKIAITTEGKIIPCVFSRKEVLGDLKKQKIKEVLESEKVKKTWGLTKDDVLVCKDCEYRYACFDCRPIASNSCNGRYFTNAPSPRCTYDPYTGKWGYGIWRVNNHGEIIYDKLPINKNLEGGDKNV